MKRFFNLLILLFIFSGLSAQLTVREDSMVKVDSEKVIDLSEVVISARNKNIDSRGLGNMKINMLQLRQSPLFFGERDIIKTLQFLPGDLLSI